MECVFCLPVDHILADKFAADAQTKIFSGDKSFPADWMALDIGPETVNLFVDEISSARTIVWNGPMGVFEMPAFAHGTMQVAQAVADNALGNFNRRRWRFCCRSPCGRSSR